MAKGFFITFEGGEGVGKSTQLSLVADALRAKGHDVLTTREPGGTDLGNELRSIVLKGDLDKMSPMTELLIFTAARSQHVERVIKPALAAGKIVISDRYAGASYAYQGYGFEMGGEKVDELYKYVFGDFQPDLTVIFDMPENAFMGKAVEINRNELRGRDFHDRVVAGYRALAKQHPERCALMPSGGSIEEVSARVMKIIGERLGL